MTGVNLKIEVAVMHQQKGTHNLGIFGNIDINLIKIQFYQFIDL